MINKFKLFENNDITKTNEFKKWFGNSKMVDKKGDPIICYHGTNYDFNKFDNKGRSHDQGYYGDGFYFTFGNDKLSEDEASYYGNKILKVYLKVEKPFDYSQLLKYKG